MKISQAQAKPGWTVLVRGRTATWQGGSIPFEQYDTFGLVVELPDRKGRVVFQASEHFAFPRGRVEEFPVSFDLDAQAPGTGDTSDIIAEAALAIAAATAAVLLGGILFVGLRNWLVGRDE